MEDQQIIESVNEEFSHYVKYTPEERNDRELLLMHRAREDQIQKDIVVLEKPQWEQKAYWEGVMSVGKTIQEFLKERKEYNLYRGGMNDEAMAQIEILQELLDKGD